MLHCPVLDRLTRRVPTAAVNPGTEPPTDRSAYVRPRDKGRLSRLIDAGDRPPALRPLHESRDSR